VKSGLPSGVLGGGAEIFGFPSAVRGIPGVLNWSHWADRGSMPQSRARPKLDFMQ